MFNWIPYEVMFRIAYVCLAIAIVLVLLMFHCIAAHNERLVGPCAIACFVFTIFTCFFMVFALSTETYTVEIASIETYANDGDIMVRLISDSGEIYIFNVDDVHLSEGASFLKANYATIESLSHKRLSGDIILSNVTLYNVTATSTDALYISGGRAV